RQAQRPDRFPELVEGRRAQRGEDPPPHAVLSGMASVDETQDWSRDPSLRSGRFDRLSDPTGSLSSSKGAERSE
ncbi:hypothetical protein, partial [Corynebacterium variabile]|uniref:hypothetical protein n=1 Tax=Corynebacterium variabile TaxID=1727 RepID=UPI002FE35A89